MKRGWTQWRDVHGDQSENFKARLCSYDARKMSKRQLDDFYSGMALIAASFVPDERFDDYSTIEDRIMSVRFDLSVEDGMRS